MNLKIISGGQTGVDRAALDAAIARGIPHGGSCPRGRLAEDGPIATRYSLQETQSPMYVVRTRTNVKDSHATVIMTLGPPMGGSRLTETCCRSLKRPYLLLDLQQTDPPQAVSAVVEFCRRHAPAEGAMVLNVAGSRESQAPGIYDLARNITEKVIGRLQHKVT